MQNNKPEKINVGLALSGASSRSVFYIGFLEVLAEHNFPIDYISALSGAAIVSASYATGTLDKLKNLVLKLNKELVFSLIERSRNSSGIYNLRKFEEVVRVFTQNKNFEDVRPRLGFVATDLDSGEPVVLQVGDLAKAICASCSVPVAFEPQAWGNRLLVDGGISTVVPGQVAREAGMDVVIGVDLRATRYVFSPWQIWLRKFLNRARVFFWPKPLGQLFQNVNAKLHTSEFWQMFFANPNYAANLKDPHIFTVIGKSLDIAISAQQNDQAGANYDCDLLISKELRLPFWKRSALLKFTNMDNTEEFYQIGRITAEEYLPEMWQLLKDKQQQKEQTLEKIKELLTQQENEFSIGE